MDEKIESQNQTFRVGADCAIIQDGIVHIYARREFRDWAIREFSRQVIFFQGRKYFLRARDTAQRPYACRYELAPWPEDLHEHSKQSFVYDEAFVALRDHAVRTEGARSLGYAFLVPLYPFLGFFWSRFQEQVIAPLGFVPRSITSASTMLQFGIVLLDGIMFGYLGGGFITQYAAVVSLHPGHFDGTSLLWDFGLLILLSLDCVIRYHQVLRGDESPDGFLEWAFRWRKRSD